MYLYNYTNIHQFYDICINQYSFEWYEFFLFLDIYRELIVKIYRRSTRSSGVAVEAAPLVLPLPKRKKNAGRVGLRSGGRAPPAKELPKIKRGAPRAVQGREKTREEESESESEESEDEKPVAKKLKPIAKVEKKLPAKKVIDQVKSQT